MMYTLLKLSQTKLQKSQVEPLQIQPRLMLGHENCSNGGRKYVSGLEHE